MSLEWKRREIPNEYAYSIAKLPNGGFIEIFHDSNVNKVSVESTFSVYSKGTAKGIPHLLEHCIFSNVIDGKPLFEARPKLTDLGIDLNAYTEIDGITLQATSAHIFDSNLYKEDEEYQEFAKTRNLKAYMTSIGEIHRNLITTKIPRDYFDKEKEIVLSEIDTNYSADALDIMKIQIPNLVYGGDYSAIGTADNIKNVPFEYIECMRCMTFREEMMTNIRIEAPYELDYKDIEIYVHYIFSALKENAEHMKLHDIYEGVRKEDLTTPDIILDSCISQYLSNGYRDTYVPDQCSYQILSVGSPIMEKTLVYDLKMVENQKKLTYGIVTLPTIELLHDLRRFDTILAINMFIDLFIEFYREKYPYMYRFDFYERIPFMIDKRIFLTSSVTAIFAETVTTEDLERTYEEFKNEYFVEKFDATLKSNITRAKNSWFSFLNGSSKLMKESNGSMVLDILKSLPPTRYLSVDDRYDIIDMAVNSKEGRALPNTLHSYLYHRDDFIKYSILELINNARFTIIKVSGNEGADE